MNLPRRSRYYGALIDCKLLEPGETDFNALNDVFVIMIGSFDIFGMGKYRYTFRMACEECPGLTLKDGAVRIFLNTRGTNPEEVSPELVELLHYLENTTPETASKCQSPRIQELQERIQIIKSNEEVGVKYMQAWEERELDRREALQQGLDTGLQRGAAALIRAYRKLGLSMEDAQSEIEAELSLTAKEAQKYLDKYWTE